MKVSKPYDKSLTANTANLGEMEIPSRARGAVFLFLNCSLAKNPILMHCMF
jgi:hypothetical protein